MMSHDATSSKKYRQTEDVSQLDLKTASPAQNSCGEYKVQDQMDTSRAASTLSDIEQNPSTFCIIASSLEDDIYIINEQKSTIQDCGFFISPRLRVLHVKLHSDTNTSATSSASTEGNPNSVVEDTESFVDEFRTKMLASEYDATSIQTLRNSVLERKMSPADTQASERVRHIVSHVTADLTDVNIRLQDNVRPDPEISANEINRFFPSHSSAYPERNVRKGIIETAMTMNVQSKL